MKNIAIIDNMQMHIQDGRGILEFENGKYEMSFKLDANDAITLETLRRHHQPWPARYVFMNSFEQELQDTALKALIRVAAGLDSNCARKLSNAVIIRSGNRMYDIKLCDDGHMIARRWRCGQLDDFEYADITGDKFMQNVVEAICVMSSACKVQA